ncbi:MAG: SDR family oxidoreductase [Marinilabiliaceae bacterium]
MRRIIINGANGYVASNFIYKLLEQDYEVVALVRENEKYSAEERMDHVLSQINNGPFTKPGNLSVYPYSLTDEDFSMPEPRLQEIFGKEADYFHFAASLKYDKKSKDEIFQVNVGGVENSIKIFSKYASGNSRFFLAGTAYSCGKWEGRFDEEFYPDEDISAFRNYYEMSKRLAENVVRKHIENNGLNGHILRLSQVVGDSRTGETKTDYGIFDFSKRVHNLAKRYPGRTVRVHVDPEGTQNVIPIDTAVNYLCQTAEKDPLPVIMNFTGNQPVKNEHIINSLNKLLPINLVPVKDIKHKEMTSLERLMAVGMSFTGNYNSLNIRFDTSKRDSVLSPQINEINEETVFKMLKYFLENITEKGAKKETASVSQ